MSSIQIFLCCTNFVYYLSWQVLKDGGQGSRVPRSSCERYWEGWFHYSNPALPESAARQYADNYGGRFFFGWERSGEDEEGW